MGFEHLARCGDLAQSDLEAAILGRETCSELLTRMAAISAADTGVAAVVSVFAAIGSSACDWVDGDLVIEMVDEDDTTIVRPMIDLGMGMREGLFKPFVLKAPLSEITAAIDRTPGLTGGLSVRKVSWRRIVLEAKEHVRRSTVPPKIGVSDESMWMLDQMKSASRGPLTEKVTTPPDSGSTARDEDWD